MKIEELIQKLPAEFHDLARRYTPVLIGWGFEDLQAWVEQIAKGNWQTAYQKLVASMDTEALIAEERKSHEILQKLNKDNAEAINLRKAIVEQVLLTSILMLAKNISE